MKNKIVITTGDVNGIGAEITEKALKVLGSKDIVLISNRKVLDIDCEMVEVPFDGEILPGQITKESGEFSFQCLKKACELRPRAIVTAPTAKEAMYLAGHFYNGQTEVLEHFLAHDSQKAEMLFVAGDFRALLLTRHCALKDVKVTKELIVEKVVRLADSLKISKPRFALCGLNPHAGEHGVIGAEEDEIIIPAVEELHAAGVDITYPKPADTLFVGVAKTYQKGEKSPYDCYIAMYHDQGLIPMKIIGGEKAVNVTIGLDILRTSPSHGTAFDIAGKGIANPNSMIEAIRLALRS